MKENEKNQKENNTNKNLFFPYHYKLKSEFDSIIITINEDNSFNIFESKFNLEFFHQYKLFDSCITTNDIINYINSLIQQNNIQIEENNMNLKMTLISPESNKPNVELLLELKDITSKELMKEMLNQINQIKNEKELFKDSLQNQINKLNEKMELIEKENKNLKEENNIIKDLFEKKINNLNNKIELLEKENQILKEEKNKKINSNTIEKRIERLEEFHFTKKGIKLSNLNLKEIKSIKSHNDCITSMSIFPSGKIISVSDDQSIRIYSINLNIIQKIEKAHDDDGINYVSVKDENNFITCSYNNIKTWINKDNYFKLNQIIDNAHSDWITKVDYFLNNKIISSSWDYTIKIWEENNKNYQNTTILEHLDKVYSFLFFDKKKLLISSGYDGTNIWDIINFKLIHHFDDVNCNNNNSLCKIDEDKIILQGINFNSLKLISISKKEVIKEINLSFRCYGILLIEDKEIFLVGGSSNDIKIYRNDNYECIQTIRNAHSDYINGFILLNNGTIASFGKDSFIKIWSFSDMPFSY